MRTGRSKGIDYVRYVWSCSAEGFGEIVDVGYESVNLLTDCAQCNLRAKVSESTANRAAGYRASTAAKQ